MRRTAAALTLFTACAASAQGGPSLPLWEAGIVGLGVAQPAYPGSAQRVRRALPLPYLIYRGEILRAERGNVGLRALKTERTELDIGFAGAFGSSADSSSARRDMRDIGTLVEFGPRLKVDLGEAGGGRWRLALPLRGVFDLSDGFAHRGVSFEPEIGWGTRLDSGWILGTSLGFVFGDRRLNDTFYGVGTDDVIAGRPAYDARSGLIATRLGLNASTRLGDDWRLFGFARLDSVAGAANRNSPLVERQRGVAVGIGVTWTFARSERRVSELPGD